MSCICLCPFYLMSDGTYNKSPGQSHENRCSLEICCSCVCLILLPWKRAHAPPDSIAMLTAMICLAGTLAHSLTNNRLSVRSRSEYSSWYGYVVHIILKVTKFSQNL